MAHQQTMPAGTKSGTTSGTGGAYRFVRDGYKRMDTLDLTTSDVESATVYGRNDETIGSVSELKLGADGEITDAVVDVGGFLGMGAHSILLPFRQLTVLRETNGTDVRIHLDTTKDKLKAIPEYKS